MKKLILFSFFLVSQVSPAQTNFFQNGATWGYSTLEHPDFIWGPYRIWLTQIDITGDTLIRNITYKKLHTYVKETYMPGSGAGIPYVVYSDYTEDYLRFDSITNEVFYTNDYDSTERLIYNFNLSKGDIVPNTVGDYYVDSIENINLFGHTVKKFYYDNDTTNPYIYTSQYIIEGMGSSNGLTLLRPDYISVSAKEITDIICFQLGSDVYPSGSQCDVFAGIDENYTGNNSALLYPNPSRNSFQIKAKVYTENMKLIIFDMLGREVFNRIIVDEMTINDFQKDGIFFWKITSEDRTMGSGKLLHFRN